VSLAAAELWAGVIAILALALILVLVRVIRRRNLEVPEQGPPGSWPRYRCPGCGAELEPGWVLLGRGAIWSPLSEGPPGTFSLVTGALPNTLSLSLPPACNRAWHCTGCSLLLVDHSRLVRPARRRQGRGPSLSG
jgi:hypothetical protein